MSESLVDKGFQGNRQILHEKYDYPYVDNYRGRPSHSFMLSAQTGGPLSTESLTKIFTTISKALPTD
ncbi:hypothetical protein PO002_45545, partial [Cupriavidus necator]